MADENTMDDIADSFVGLRFLPDDQSIEALAATIKAIDAEDCVAVVVPELGATGAGRLAGVRISAPIDGQLLARCEPMTDAIKRVAGNRVVETVDREQLTIVALPMVVPIGLAKRWAAAVLANELTDDPSAAPFGGAANKDDGDASGDEQLERAPERRPTAAALLSQLVNIEPVLRVVGIDDIS